jgi:hypothetical protein
LLERPKEVHMIRKEDFDMIKALKQHGVYQKVINAPFSNDHPSPPSFL